MIRFFGMERQAISQILILLANLCQSLTEDITELKGSAIKEDIESVRTRYYEIEGIKKTLDSIILSLRRYRNPRRQNLWLTEHREINLIYFRSMSRMLEIMKLYRQFLFEHQQIAFATISFHVMSDYEILLRPCISRGYNDNVLYDQNVPQYALPRKEIW